MIPKRNKIVYGRKVSSKKADPAWCSYCRRGKHDQCPGTRMLNHGGRGKCECQKCSEKRKAPGLR